MLSSLRVMPVIAVMFATCIGATHAASTGPQLDDDAKQSHPRQRQERRIQFYIDAAKDVAIDREERNAVLDDHFAAQRKTLQTEAFSVKHGGTVFKRDIGKIRMELGVWAEDGRFTFLRFSW